MLQRTWPGFTAEPFSVMNLTTVPAVSDCAAAPKGPSALSMLASPHSVQPTLSIKRMPSAPPLLRLIALCSRRMACSMVHGIQLHPPAAAV